MIHSTTSAAAVSSPLVGFSLGCVLAAYQVSLSNSGGGMIHSTTSAAAGIQFRLCFSRIPSFIVTFRRGDDPQYYFSSSSELASRV
eukprot:CCRYP_000437-RD/>CCRYP_000437-RD protein AED:0.17 eAED:0.20 QI:372/1/1/1/0/0/6/9/85